MTQRSARVDGPPPKTVLTATWLAALGIAVFALQNLTVGPTVAMASAPVGPAPAWSAPLPAPPPEDEDLTAFAPQKQTVRPRVAHQPIEDPSDSLCPFYRALKELDDRKAPGSPHVRILHYGDSILTTDELSGRVRRALQSRFGDGGHGFVLLGQPWRWYHHLDVDHGANHKWTMRPLSSDPVRDGLFGLGGVAFETSRSGAKAWAGTAPEGALGREVASYDISYLEQPRGGSFEIYVNDQLYETLSTRADAVSVQHRRLEVSPGESKLMVRTLGDGNVRVFGAVLESDRPGVVYDSLAINGVRTGLFNRFDRTHWQQELRRRKPNLVVFMCGANEGNNDELALGYYRTQLEGILQEIHDAVPEAGCLVMGPLDQAMRDPNGELVSKRMPRKLTRVQREVSLDNHCAFFNTYEAMGGKDSMAKWYRRGLGGGDFIHPTEQGARKIGSWLAEALFAGFENYVFNGEQCELNVTSL